MKKLYLLLSLMFIMSITAISQTNINVWGGYSWINGIIGIETQYKHFGIGAGYMPTKIVNTGENIPSFGGTISYYTKTTENIKSRSICYYGSIGITSAGYTYQNSLSEDIIVPLTYGMVGIKGTMNKLSFKAGVGYGWSEKFNTLTFEIGLSYTLFTNH